MPRKIDESNLTKGELRKLNALRKSLGPDIADKAFSEWLAASGVGAAAYEDKNIQIISGVLEQAIAQHGMTFPRGGYLLKRGRGPGHRDTGRGGMSPQRSRPAGH